MASGDPTLTLHGVYDMSGAALQTAVDAITPYHPLLSGASIHFIPAGDGQCSLVSISVEGFG